MPTDPVWQRLAEETNTPEKWQAKAKDTFPLYSREDILELQERYTPKQMEAIKAGEEAIKSEELFEQGRYRMDPYRLPYFDDFALRQPVIDKKEWKTDVGRPDHKARFMTAEEFEEDFNLWLNKFVHPSLKQHPDEVLRGDALDKNLDIEDITPTDWLEYLNDRSVFTGGVRSDLKTQDALAPTLMRKVPGVAGQYEPRRDPDLEDPDEKSKSAPGQALSPTAVAAMKKGWSEKALSNVRLRVIESKRVTNQTRLGKVYSVRYTVIAGNGDGWLGVAMTKGIDTNVMLLKAKALAILNMRPIRRYEDRTIYGNSKAKFGGTEVKLFARPPGTEL